MAATTKWLPIEDIRPDGGTQTRSELRPDIIQEYAEAMTAGAKFPPVDVFWDANRHYWLADGFHRFQAAMQSEADKLECRIHKGELRDAIWFALSANATNGLRRTNADKRRCVTTALSDKEWANLSNREIADHVGVSDVFVMNVRGEVLTVSNSDTRTGKDGKKYKAKKPKRHPKPAPQEPDDDDLANDPNDDAREAQAIIGRMKQKQRALGVLDDLCLMLEALGVADELSEHTDAIREKLTD